MPLKNFRVAPFNSITGLDLLDTQHHLMAQVENHNNSATFVSNLMYEVKMTLMKYYSAMQWLIPFFRKYIGNDITY